jgi:signal transduction histidine kinase
VTVLAVGGWIAALGGCTTGFAARRALVRRTEDLACATHELRGAIGAARLAVAAAGRAREPSQRRLRAVELELDRAALALEDLDGRRHWVFGYVDVGELLADSVEAWQAAAEARGAELGLRWSGCRALVIGDRVRLAQVTGNLIANAIEHGGGRVEVRGRLDGEAVRIEVSDEGPGLPATVLELAGRARALEPPGYARATEPPGTPGRGHGLGIAAALVDGHGGRLSSAPSVRGARLVVELPAAHSLEPRARAGVAGGA